MKNTKYTLITLLMIFTTSMACGQLSSTYKLELKKRLDPETDTTTTKVVALNIMRPSFTLPESSIRIVDICNLSFIEVRIMEKNFWEELISNNSGKAFSKVTSFFSKPISDAFRNKIVMSFSKIIETNQAPSDSSILQKKVGSDVRIRLYDGIVYEFRAIKNGNSISTLIKRELKPNDFDYKIMEICSQITNDLKNGYFNESNYNF